MSAPDVPRTVKLVQGIWCDHGQHVVPIGGKYHVTEIGLFCCVACREKIVVGAAK